MPIQELKGIREKPPIVRLGQLELQLVFVRFQEGQRQKGCVAPAGSRVLRWLASVRKFYCKPLILGQFATADMIGDFSLPSFAALAEYPR